MLVLVVPVCCCFSIQPPQARVEPLSAAIDAACALPASGSQLRDAYRSLQSFGSVQPPLPPRDTMVVSELQEVTGLPATAFAPRQPKPAGTLAQLPAAAAAVCVQLLLAALAVSDEQPLAEAWRGLKALELWQLPPLLLGLCGGSLLLAAVVDKLVLRGSLLNVVARMVQPPARREVVLRHEAGHFLLAHLLGFPVQVTPGTCWAAAVEEARPLRPAAPVARASRRRFSRAGAPCVRRRASSTRSASSSTGAPFSGVESGSGVEAGSGLGGGGAAWRPARHRSESCPLPTPPWRRRFGGAAGTVYQSPAITALRERRCRPAVAARTLAAPRLPRIPVRERAASPLPLAQADQPRAGGPRGDRADGRHRSRWELPASRRKGSAHPPRGTV